MAQGSLQEAPATGIGLTPSERPVRARPWAAGRPRRRREQGRALGPGFHSGLQAQPSVTCMRAKDTAGPDHQPVGGTDKRKDRGEALMWPSTMHEQPSPVRLCGGEGLQPSQGARSADASRWMSQLRRTVQTGCPKAQNLLPRGSSCETRHDKHCHGIRKWPSGERCEWSVTKQHMSRERPQQRDPHGSHRGVEKSLVRSSIKVFLLS